MPSSRPFEPDPGNTGGGTRNQGNGINNKKPFKPSLRLVENAKAEGFFISRTLTF